MAAKNREDESIERAALAELKGWGFERLTPVQEDCLRAGVLRGASLVVSAPTSSGKTLVAEMAMLGAIERNTRVLYLVSHRALAYQKFQDFQKRFGDGALTPRTTVGLQTGDRQEGPVDARILVATYERAIGLVLSDQVVVGDTLVVADEIQILADAQRGAEIEILCAILRKRKLRQFIALSATTANAADLAGWMECQLVQSTHRAVPLHQEIWKGGRAYRVEYGQDVGEELDEPVPLNDDIHAVVDWLLKSGRGPVLVFAETRREVRNLAASYSSRRVRHGDGLAVSRQLELFAEPTESSSALKENTERRVAFHSADLTAQEREVIETGFIDNKLDVCFATSTLAAGVNFPFRTVVFASMTYKWGDREGTTILRSDYRNMSGRAGRLGVHDAGYAVLLPLNKVELTAANQLVLPENDRVDSALPRVGLRKIVLSLVVSGSAHSADEAVEFFRNTLYWYQTLERNSAHLADLTTRIGEALAWLADNGLVEIVENYASPTRVGRATARAGLSPATAAQFRSLLSKIASNTHADLEKRETDIVAAVCACSEFTGKTRSRFLPYARPTGASGAFLRGKTSLAPFDSSDDSLVAAAHAACLYAAGVEERSIMHQTGISAGQLHRLALDVAWALDGLHRIACVPDLGCTQPTCNFIGMLAKRVRWGVPPDALDMLRVAERHNVPGFGRQRAMRLLSAGINSLHALLGRAREEIHKLMGDDRRSEALIRAASDVVGVEADQMKGCHLRVAKPLGIEEIVRRCYEDGGTDFEDAVLLLLKAEPSWHVERLDDGKRQNVPDLHLTCGTLGFLIECKSRQAAPFMVKKEEAWAILQKAADFDPKLHRVSLAKPGFDSTSLNKGVAAVGITLVQNGALIEAVLRVRLGRVSSMQFAEWLSQDGVAEIERLPGSSTCSA